METITVARGVLTRLETAWRRSDALFGMLGPGALFAQPIALRQPFIFYLGHLPAFAWNQVGRGVFGRESFAPDFDVLFERGIDPTDIDRYAAPAAESWPSLARILEYRDRVREALRACAEEAPEATDASDPLLEGGRIFHVALEHELMHHETFLYMLQQLPHASKVKPPALPPPRVGRGGRASVVEVPSGRASLGVSLEDLPFAWDNEVGRLEVDLPAFRIDTLPVRNAELREFVEAGGYERRELWTAAAWDWKARSDVRHPAVWERRDDAWWYRDLFQDRPFSEVEDWPAYVSWAEADAFARWRGARLPTEPEVWRAAYGSPHGDRRQPWGDAGPSSTCGNFDLCHWSPVPVGSHPAGQSAWGVHELVGNGWEWTSTPFEGLPGFAPYIRTYPGYSADFFDGRHYVLRGASWATDAQLVRRSFRNWFQPHYPYVFAKFRCVRPAAG